MDQTHLAGHDLPQDLNEHVGPDIPRDDAAVPGRDRLDQCYIVAARGEKYKSGRKILGLRRLENLEPRHVGH